jgi:hypothetical protein
VSAKRHRATSAEAMADLIAAGAFKPIDEIIFNSALFTKVESPRPTPEQVLYARVKRELKAGERRMLPIKWGRWKAADPVIRTMQGKLKRLPNGMKEKVFEAISKSLEGGPFHGGADVIRKDYFLIHGLVKKLDPT